MKILLIFFVTLACFEVAFSFNGIISVEQHDLKYDENLMSIDLNLKKKSDKIVINFKSEVFEDVTEPIYIHSAVFERAEDGEYKHLMNTSVNACNVLNRLKKRPIVKAIMKEIMRTSNIPLECPYKKGTYFMKDFVLDDGLIPPFVQPFMPSGNFMSIVSIGRMIDDIEMTLMRVRLVIDIDPSRSRSARIFQF